jgi:hypothetical protein
MSDAAKTCNDWSLNEAFARIDDCRICVDILNSKFSADPEGFVASGLDDASAALDEEIKELERHACMLVERLTGFAFGAIARRLA